MCATCSEGEVKEAKPDDDIDFGAVTSCMTITCILEDGGKVAAHDAIYQRVSPHIFEALKRKLDNRKVARVVAAGSGSCWTPEMQSQAELADSFQRNSGTFAQKSQLDQLADMAPHLVSRNVEHFKRKLALKFGTESVEFTDFDDGRIWIDREGHVHTG
jgi:hypothetical protein